jgi:TctA family transporter
MISTLEASITGLLSLSGLLYLSLGVIFGLVVGILPGLGGMFALSMLLPIILNLDPYSGLSVLIGAHAATPAGGSITAILLGVPGTLSSAATVLDGFPMGKQGKGGEAIGAALTSSALGGILGAVILLLMVPVLKKAVLAFGPSEMVMLTLLGISFIGTLGGKGGVAKAWISGFLGLFFATIRLDLVTSRERFTFGLVELWDGLPLIAVVLGLFAIAEMIELSSRKDDYYAGNKLDYRAFRDMLKGLKITFSRFNLVARCSGIGVLVGMIPGIGGETAIFLAYGHSAQTSREREKFGQGAIEGIIAPEAANNAKEGGAFIPTIGLGVPGSGLMALFLGAFMVMGLYPGPGLLLNSMDIVLSMIWALILASVLASILAFFAAPPMIKIVYKLKSSWLAVSVVVLAGYGVYVCRGSIIDLIILVLFGLLGTFMNFFHFSRAGFLVGFVLGHLLEKNVQQAYGVYGWDFFLQPISVIILLVILGGIFIPLVLKKKRSEVHLLLNEKIYSGVFIGFFVLTGIFSLRLGVPSSLAPVIISAGGLLASVFYFIRAVKHASGKKSISSSISITFVFLISLFILLTYFFGFYLSATLLIGYFLIILKKEKIVSGIIVTGCVIFLLLVIGFVFELALPSAKLIEIINL